jgi:SAM-dependent methyltransferase
MKSTHIQGPKSLKTLVAATPLLGPAARSIFHSPPVKWFRNYCRRLGFRSSSSYWELRYKQGGTSGAGSYGLLAEFKAEILNDFVARMDIASVIEFGCGDGAQLALAKYPRYVGIDVAPRSISACRERFSGDNEKSFYLASQIPADLGRSDLALSLDVIYHLVEESVFDSYMRSLFAASDRFVVIYSSNKEELSDAPHVRHRLFSKWIGANEPQWVEKAHIPNKYPFNPAQPAETSFADFYFFERMGNPLSGGNFR